MYDLKDIARRIVEEAKALGAEHVQCFVRENKKEEFNVDGGKFSLMRTLFDRDVSVTVLKQQRKGAVKINRFDEAAVSKAVRQCVAASESAEPDPAWEFAAGPAEAAYEDGAPVCDREKLFERTRELLKDVNERHPKIMMEQMITDHTTIRTVYLNSNGVSYDRLSGSYSFSLMYSAHEGEKGSSFFGSDVTLTALDRPVIECGAIERELAAVERQIDTEPLEGKFVGTAVLAPSALGEVVVSTILDSFVSDSSLIDGTSIWKDKLGEQVADGRLSISFRPRADFAAVGQRFTSEGYEAKDFDLIRDGRLASFRLSQYGANKTGGTRAGNESWNLEIPAGQKTLKEIIAGIDRGIFVRRFSGGQPASSGEFSGVAKNSFMIENGKITCALKETMISGCVPDMLNNIREISSDVLRDGTVSVPYIAFDGITISGK